MIKSAAIVKTKTLAPWRELRLQKRKAKKVAMLERKAIKQYYPSRIDAIEVKAPDDAPPTRTELEAKATELGIKFDGRTKDKKLGQLIQDRLSTGE